MMTPVYEVAIADWKNNSCSINQYAARPGFSIFFTNIASQNNSFPIIIKHLFVCCFHNLKKHTLQCFRSVKDETARKLQGLKKQHVTKNIFLSSGKSSKRDICCKHLSHNLYSFEVNSITYCNVVNSGTDVLWQQEKFELKVRKARVMYFVATSKSNRRTPPQPPLTRRSNAA